MPDDPNQSFSSLDPKRVQALFDNGSIDQSTYDRMMNISVPPTPTVPTSTMNLPPISGGASPADISTQLASTDAPAGTPTQAQTLGVNGGFIAGEGNTSADVKMVPGTPFVNSAGQTITPMVRAPYVSPNANAPGAPDASIPKVDPSLNPNSDAKPDKKDEKKEEEDLSAANMPDPVLPRFAGGGTGAKVIDDAMKSKRDADNAALDEKKNAEISKAAIASESGNKIGEILTSAQDKAQADMDRDNLIRDRAKAEVDKEQAAATQTALDLANQKIDPNRVFNRQGTFGAILNTVALALGAFGAKVSGKNSAVESINHILEADVDAQKSDLANQRSALNTRIDINKSKAAGLEADAAHRYAVTMQGLEFAKQRANILAAKSTNDQTAANLQSLTADIDQKKAEVSANYELFRGNRLIAQENAAASAHNAAQAALNEKTKSRDALVQKLVLGDEHNAPMALDKARDLANRMTFNLPTKGAPVPTRDKGGKEPPMINLPDGTQAEAVSPEAAEDARVRLMAGQEVRDSVRQLNELRAKHPAGGAWSPSDTRVAAGLALHAKNAMTQLNGIKRMPGETEFHELDKIVPDNPLDFNFSGSTQAALDAADRLAKGQIDNVMRYSLKNPPKPEPSAQEKADADVAKLKR